MKDNDERIKGFWYRSLLPISDEPSAKIIYIPLHYKYFSSEGVTGDKLKNFEIELYSIREFCNEFKYMLFEHLSNNRKIEDLFFNVMKDFIETFYRHELTEFLSIFSKGDYEVTDISLMIDRNIRDILNICFETNLLSEKDLATIEYFKSEEITEKAFLEKFFKKTFL